MPSINLFRANCRRRLLALVSLFAAVIACQASAQGLPVQNGGFEDGLQHWTKTGNFYALSGMPSPRTGQRYLHVSNADGTAGVSLFGVCTQSVEIPDDATQAIFSYWWDVTSSDPAVAPNNDSLCVSIWNSAGTQLLANLGCHSNLNAAGGYRSASADITNLRGQTIQLQFLTSSNNVLPTTFRVDDVKVEVTLPGTIATSPNTITRQVNAGQDAASAVLTISNSGGYNGLDYSVSDNRPWMAVTPDSGTTVNVDREHTVVFSTAGLAPGAYSGSITITDGDATNSPKTVSVSLTVNGAQSPPNDLCVNAISVGLGDHVFATSMATTDGPTPSSCRSSTGTQIGADVWFRYAALADGALTASTCSSDFDTVLLVYRNESCPVANSRQMACYDDVCGQGNLRATAAVQVEAGQSYLIRVGGFNSETGSGMLRLAFQAAPEPPTNPVPLPTVTQNKLIFITHGWNTSEATFEQFWVPLAAEISDLAPDDWQVVLFDWTEPSRAVILPDFALQTALLFGNMIGHDYAEQVVNSHRWQQVHLIGHSAGSAMIARIAQRINEADTANEVVIHTTFLDAYAGVVWDIDDYAQFYGGNSDWAEHYRSEEELGPCTRTDGSTTIGTGGPTQLVLPRTHTFDVTFADPEFDPNCLSRHAWPYIFYRNTVDGAAVGTCGAPGGSNALYGFSLSRAVCGDSGSGWTQRVTSAYPINRQTTLGPTVSPVRGMEVVVSTDPVMNLEEAEHTVSDASAVITIGPVMSMTTQPAGQAMPVTVWSDIAIARGAGRNFVHFDLSFSRVAGAAGLLSVYIDGVQVGAIDEAHAPGGRRPYAVPIPAGANAESTLSFRLDPHSSIGTSITVQDVSIGVSGLREVQAEPTDSDIVVLQPGPEGKDTCYGTVYVQGGGPDMPIMYNGGWADEYHDLIEFDVESAPGAHETAACVLQLYAQTAPNDPMLQIRRITEGWQEGGVTVSNNPSSVFHSDFGPLVPPTGWRTVDITDLYKGWKGGQFPNHGIKLSPTYLNQSNGAFLSSDNPDPTLRPKLVIYTCSSDFNGDTDFGTDQDIEAFFACLAGNCCTTCGSADFNRDGDTGTDQDIESFFRVLAGGPCG